MVRSYLLIALGAMLVLLGIAAAASRWVTRPVEKAWKQQRQFLSDASHELKTPLTVILSNAELLEGAGLAEKPARWSGNIHTEAQQMRTLVEQMLTLARADNGVRPAAMEPLNLSDVATDCVLPLSRWPLRRESPWRSGSRRTLPWWGTLTACGG